MKVAVTGASGSLAKSLLDLLLPDSSIDQVVAIDRSELARSHPKLTFRRCDIVDGDLQGAFGDCDAVVHLAFIVERGSRDRAQTDAVNVTGTRRVFEAAADSGVKQVVYASSIASYGIHPENRDVVITEDTPIRANPEFYYSQNKADNELWIDEFERRHPEMTIARMRPSVFLSERSVRSAQLLQSPLHFYPGGHGGCLQVTHEEDVAEAFVLALKQRAHGAYNVSVKDALTPHEMGRAMGKRCVPLPRGLLSLYRIAYRLGWADVDPIWLEFGVDIGIEVSAEKLHRELGWEPRFKTTAEVLRHLSGRPNAVA